MFKELVFISIKLLMFSNFLSNLIMSVTFPIVQLGFLKQLQGTEYSIIQFASQVIAALMSIVFIKKKYIKKSIKHIKILVICEVSLFSTLSLSLVNYPFARMLCMGCVMAIIYKTTSVAFQGLLNRIYNGDKLTVVSGKLSMYSQYGSVIGASMSIPISQYINLEEAVYIQVIGLTFVSIFQILSVSKLNKEL